MAIRASFMTGSRVYGKPRKDSDWDVVLLMDRKDLEAVFNEVMPESALDYEIDEDSHSIRKGNVNFICCFTEKRFNSFKRSVDKLLQIAPVSREVAIEVHKDERAKEGG